MTECKACINENLISGLYYDFKKADIEFCADMLSSELTDSIKWEINDTVSTFCEKHKLEFLES